MKNPFLILSLLAAVLTTGCQPSEEKAALQIVETAAQHLVRAQAATRVAAEQMRDQVFAQRAEFVAQMHEQLLDLHRSLESLSMKIARTSLAAQAEAAPQLEVLCDQARRLNRQLGEVINATPATWSVTKVESEKTCAALKDGLAAAHLLVGNRLAP